MSIDPIQLNDDNFKFIMMNKNIELSHIDITNDGHLVKVTWLKWVVRIIKNFFTNGSIDQKVYQAFCQAMSGVNPLPFAKFQNVANRVTYLTAIIHADNDLVPDDEEETEAQRVDSTARTVLDPQKSVDADKNKRQFHLDDEFSSSDDEKEVGVSKPKLSLPTEPLTLDMLGNVLQSNNVSLENKEEENVEKFVEVLVEFAKHFSVADIVNKVVRMKEYKLDFSRTVLTNMVRRELELKVEENPAFLNCLQADNQKALEPFVKQLEDAAKKKAEEAEAARKEKEEAAAQEEAQKANQAPPADPNRDILEEGLQVLDALIQNEDEIIDFDVLVTILNDAWAIIQTYPKPEHGIPDDLAAKIADITQKLGQHVQDVYSDEHDETLITSVWNQITNHLGLEAPFEKDTTLAERHDELHQFAIRYLQENWNAAQEMDEAQRRSRQDRIEDCVKEIIRENVELEDIPLIEKICEEFDLPADDLVNRWLDL